MEPIELNTLSDNALAPYAGLTERQLRNRRTPSEGLFIVESPKVIAVALDAGMEPVSLLCEHRHLTGDAAAIIARMPHTPVYTGSRDLLSELTGYTLTRGVLCCMRRPPEKVLPMYSAAPRALPWWIRWSTTPTSERFSARPLLWASMRLL